MNLGRSTATPTAETLDGIEAAEPEADGPPLPSKSKVAVRSRRLTDRTTIGHHPGTVNHTTVSWSMCMRWRPRRAEDGV